VSTGELAILLVATLGALAGGLAGIPRLFRKTCPQCGRRSVASHGFDAQAARPRVFRVYECVRCRIVYASADGRTLIPRDQWEAGVRDVAPRATVIRDGS